MPLFFLLLCKRHRLNTPYQLGQRPSHSFKWRRVRPSIYSSMLISLCALVIGCTSSRSSSDNEGGDQAGMESPLPDNPLDGLMTPPAIGHPQEAFPLSHQAAWFYLNPEVDVSTLKDAYTLISTPIPHEEVGGEEVENEDIGSEEPESAEGEGSHDEPAHNEHQQRRDAAEDLISMTRSPVYIKAEVFATSAPPTADEQSQEEGSWWQRRVSGWTTLPTADGPVDRWIEITTTYHTLPPTEFLGPKVSVHLYRVEEYDAPKGQKLWTLSRTYQPNFTLFLDSRDTAQASERVTTRRVMMTERIEGITVIEASSEGEEETEGEAGESEMGSGGATSTTIGSGGSEGEGTESAGAESQSEQSGGVESEMGSGGEESQSGGAESPSGGTESPSGGTESPNGGTESVESQSGGGESPSGGAGAESEEVEVMMREVERVVTVTLSEMSQPISIRGGLLEDVYSVEIDDSGDEGADRVFWVQPGVGIVRWYDQLFGQGSLELWYE